MNVLIVYDSAYGNTEKIAVALADTVTLPDTATITLVRKPHNLLFDDYDLVVVGSPTQGGRPTQKIQDFIAEMPSDCLAQKYAAAFDTRFDIDKQNLGLRMLMKTIGYAAPRISAGLHAKGARLVAKPEGFIVSDKEGPLEDGELERAQTWMRNVVDLSAA